MRGQPLTILMPEEYREAHLGGFRRYLETRETRIIGRTVEVRGRRNGGETFPLEMSLSARLLGDLHHVLMRRALIFACL